MPAMDSRGDVVRVRDHENLSRHHPQYVYESRVPCPVYAGWEGQPADIRCQVNSNIREAGIWCDECAEAEVESPCYLLRSYTAAPFSFPQVWQDTDQINMTTGRVETDPKKFKQHLADKSKEMEDRLGQRVDYQPVDPTDKAALGVTDEGLDATHDHQVRTGQKDSRGRFVWTV